MWHKFNLYIRDFAIIITGAIIFNTFAFAAFHIPSGSMEPTLEVGDRVFVSKFSYGYNQYSIPFDPDIGEARSFYDAPMRGDVAVFSSPRGDGTDLIKRVVGMPGDQIQMKNGRLHINGEKIKREFVRRVSYTNYQQQKIMVREYTETLPDGSSHQIYERSDNGYYDNTPIIIVPAEHFFMMGDNRDSSADSRSDLGPINKKYLMGRAEITSFSLYDCDQGKDIACWGNIPTGRFFKPL